MSIGLTWKQNCQTGYVSNKIDYANAKIMP